jgi:transcriptional regulator with XRE-family HTH domain
MRSSDRVTADPFGDAWRAQLAALGGVIRTQRQLSKLSLRDLAARTDVSNAYLSQIERGMHEPSVRVLRAIAEALSLPPDDLLREAGLLDPDVDGPADARSTEAAIRADPNLTDAQKEALLTVYRSYRSERAEPTDG